MFVDLVAPSHGNGWFTMVPCKCNGMSTKKKKTINICPRNPTLDHLLEYCIPSKDVGTMVYFFITRCRVAVAVFGNACGCGQKGAIRTKGKSSKEGDQVLVVEESVRRRPSI